MQCVHAWLTRAAVPRRAVPPQLRQSESRVQSRELRERRRAFLAAERERKEAEAARRCGWDLPRGGGASKGVCWQRGGDVRPGQAAPPLPCATDSLRKGCPTPALHCGSAGTALRSELTRLSSAAALPLRCAVRMHACMHVAGLRRRRHVPPRRPQSASAHARPRGWSASRTQRARGKRSWRPRRCVCTCGRACMHADGGAGECVRAGKGLACMCDVWHACVACGM